MSTKAVLRKETFGALLYIRENSRYYIMDEFAFRVIKEIMENGIQSAYRLDKSVTNEDINKFIDNISKLNIMKNHEFNIRLIDNLTIQNNNTYLSAPLKVFISITEYCNLNCKHCFGMYGEKIYMDLNEYIKTLDQLYDCGVCEIGLTGGEPFLHPNIVEILKYTFDKGFKINISTNGTIFKKEIIEILLFNVKNISRISVSLDGLKETHNKIRGAHIFDIVINNIKEYKKLGIPTSFNYVINNMNYNELDEFLEYMYINDIHNGSFTQIKCVGNAKNSDLIFKENEYQNIRMKFDNSIKNFAKKTKKYQFTCGTIVDDNGNMHLEHDSILKYMDSKFCGAGVLNASIDSKGNVSPCTFLCEYFTETKKALGNMGNNSFNYIWNNNPQFMETRKLKPSSNCIKCDEYSKKLCYGGCPGDIYGMRKDIGAMNPFCKKGVGILGEK